MFKNNRLNICIFIYLYAIFCVINSETVIGTYNPNNYHFYYYSSVTRTNTDAKAFCAGKQIENTNGYLVTITSSQEWEWIFSQWPTLSIWASGTDLGSTGIWRYDSGPENGVNMYNLYFDKCYSFAGWNVGEPNLIVNENYINARATSGKPTFNNIDNGTSSKFGVLCEWDFVPYISPSPTDGGLITISKLSGYNLNNLLVTFISQLDSSETEYSTFQTINSNQNSVTLNLNSGVGNYLVEISDGLKTSQPLPWSYELPFISTVYPKFLSGEIVTVVGTNFGNKTTQVGVTFTESASVGCDQVAFIIPNKAFTCTLTSSVSSSLIPITVTIGQLSYKSYKTSLYYSETGMLYSGFQSLQTFTNTMNNYAALLKLDGLDGYLSVIESSQIYTFIKKSLSVTTWQMWQAASYDPSKGLFTYLAGPKTGNTTIAQDIYYPSSTYPSATQRYYISDSGSVIPESPTVATNKASITQYGGYSPSFLDGTQTFPVLTQGQTIFLKLKNFGITLSNYEILINNIEFPASNYKVDYINGGIYLNIPSSFILGGPYNIEVNIDSVTTVGGTKSITQAPPTISSISSTPTSGGQVTITGSSLLDQTSELTITIGGKPCTDIVYETFHYIVLCNITGGTGILTPVSVTVGDVSSNTAPQFSYVKPNITSLTKSPTTGGRIEIEGSNFGTDPNVITITIGGNTCGDIEILNNQTTIACKVSSGQGIQPVEINVNGLEIDSLVNFVYQTPSISNIVQNNSVITIIGENFGQNFGSGGTIIKIDDQDITSSCSGNDTVITCEDIPIGGELSITNGGDTFTNPTNFYSDPYIDGISEQITCMKADQKIHLQGGYFENINSTGSVTFLLNSITYENFTVESSIQISFFIPIGTGILNQVNVKFDNRISNTFIFAYCPPEIQLPIIQEGNTLVINGSGFGDVAEKIEISFGSIGSSITADQVNNYQITFTIPESSKDSNVQLKVDSQFSTQEYFTLKPIISSITKPFMNGSLITITGDFLSTTNIYGEPITRIISYCPENSSTFTPYDQCNYISQDTPYSIECLQGSGFGELQIQIVDSNNTLLTTLYNQSYQTPLVIRSTTPIYKRPGIVTITAQSFNSSDIQVYIESTLCSNPVAINSETIQCLFESNIPPKKSGQALDIQIKSNGIMGDIASVLFYTQDYDCLNNCSGNGRCNRKTGVCYCDENWTDLDCSLNSSDLLPIPPPSVDNLAVVTLPAIKLDFQVSVSHLREIDFSGKTVRVLRTKDIMWVEKKDSTDQKSHYFKGIFKNDSVVLEFNVTLFENATTIDFAEQEMSIQANSMKYLITISNWNFSSEVNQLQVIYTSTTSKESIYNCESANTTNIQPSGETLTWFKIKSGATSLNARFSNRAIVDDRLFEISISNLNQTDELYQDFPTLLETDDGDLEENDQVYLLTSLVSPSFQKSIVLDPDFGALLRSESKDKCNESFAKWKIALIVVFGSAALAIPAASIVYIRYRPQINYKMKSLSDRVRSIRGF